MNRLAIATVLLMSVQLAWSDSDADINACMARALESAGDNVTIGDLRKSCREEMSLSKDADVAKAEPEKKHESAITRRMKFEQEDERNPFAILPHRPNYAIFAYNTKDPNTAPFEEAFPDEEFDFDNLETKFQISIKVPIVYDVFGDNGDLFVAYTNRSFWQSFNNDISSPFRDTNHEPEAWFSFRNDWEILGLRNSLNRVGLSHQSNGRAGPLSRSWNRVYADFIFEHEDFYFSLKPWWRIPEDSDNDDNPDITDYMGNFEFLGVYKLQEQTISFLVRNNLDFSGGENRGALQVDYSFPISGNLRGYLQWFNGYGESLIDYNAKVNSVGAGIQISDWL